MLLEELGDLSLEGWVAWEEEDAEIQIGKEWAEQEILWSDEWI